jgi:hypothetical protein
LPDDTYAGITKALNEWKTAWDDPAQRPRLRTYRSPDGLLIEDLRRDGDPGTFDLRGDLAAVYDAVYLKPLTAKKIAEVVEVPATDLDRMLDDFVDVGLMMRDGNLFLSLAVPATAGR